MLSCRYTPAFLGLLLLGTGCKDQRAPDHGTYTLQQMDGKAIPGMLEFTNGCVVTLLGGAVTLMPSDSFTSTFSIRRQCGDSIAAEDPGTRGLYTVIADTLYFGNDAGTSGGTAVFTVDTLFVTGPRHVLTYVIDRD
jgi:hypothetical protein